MTDPKDITSVADEAMLERGPWAETTVTTLAMKPIEVTVTKRCESTHLPPLCPHTASKPESSVETVIELLRSAVPLIIERLDAIRSAQSEDS
ncbi:hypothetical protein LCGC14_1679020 [marine sediment metagenome]|uniref:Uncharacterized protein n=1 Tax=marine sediment metagenome TaxID=412755 RepID=A0A0F9K4Y9_9ZZZZ